MTIRFSTICVLLATVAAGVNFGSWLFGNGSGHVALAQCSAMLYALFWWQEEKKFEEYKRMH